MIDPTNTLGTKLHRDAKKYEALKADLEPMIQRLDMFDELVSAVAEYAILLKSLELPATARMFQEMVDRARALPK